jgi:RNA 2',3'-cyclic 3'-phosphodiesterase
MRLFISIEMPSKIIEYITTIQKQLGIGLLFEGRLTKPEHIHLTLKFLGDVQQEHLLLIQQALASIYWMPFEVCLGSLGVLPSDKSVRIIWLDLVGNALTNLAGQIHEVLAPIIQFDDHGFLSHITLARVKKVYDYEQLRQHLEKIVIEKHCFSISKFVLKQSFLSSEGPEYIDISWYYFCGY